MQTDMKNLLIDAFSQIPNFVFIKDVDLIYRACNQNFAEFSGFKTHTEVEGKTDFDMPWSTTHTHLYRDEDLAVIQSGKSFELKEVPMRIGNEDKVLLVSKAALFNNKNEVIGILGVYIDISEQKNLERELKIARDRAETASRSKSEFIANMSHDIRTPVTGILAMAQHMINAVNDSKASLTQSNLFTTLNRLMSIVDKNSQLLMNATNELLTLCNDILDVVKLESGKSEKSKEIFQVQPFIQHAIDLLIPVAHDKGLSLSSSIDKDVPDYLKGERLYFDRILLNLTSNALKFTNQGFVKIGLNIDSTHIENASPKRIVQIILTVSDSGVGIPEDKQEVIFEHFSRLTESYSGIYKGAGLGLYTVKNTVALMGGKVQVTSKVGHGSTFYITLPFEIPSKDEISQVKLQSQPTINSVQIGNLPIKKGFKEDYDLADQTKTTHANNAKILIVEDSQLAAIGLETQLKRFNCDVWIAESGKDALSMAEQTQYDLIFLDMGLPDVSGVEVAQNIRSSQVPIVAVTGHGDNPDKRQACLDAGVQIVLCKPTRIEEVEAILQQFAPKALIKST